MINRTDYDRDKKKRLDMLYSELECASRQIEAVQIKIKILEDETYEQFKGDERYERYKARRDDGGKEL